MKTIISENRIFTESTRIDARNAYANGKTIVCIKPIYDDYEYYEFACIRDIKRQSKIRKFNSIASCISESGKANVTFYIGG